MKNINFLVVDDYEWNAWFKHGSDRSCSGIYGGCEYCLKKMYTKRSIYLTAYVSVFLNNKDNIKNNIVRMPLLRWFPAPTAKSYNVETFHLKKCGYIEHYLLCKQLFITYFIQDIVMYLKKFIVYHDVNCCSCNAALFFRCCYGHIYEGREEECRPTIRS